MARLNLQNRTHEVKQGCKSQFCLRAKILVYLFFDYARRLAYLNARYFLTKPHGTTIDSSFNKIIHPHLAILSAAAHSLIAQPDTRDGSCVSSEGLLALPTPRVPHFHRPIVRAGDDTQVVGGDGPDPLNVAEIGSDAPTCSDFPEPNGGVQGRGEDVARWIRPVWLI